MGIEYADRHLIYQRGSLLVTGVSVAADQSILRNLTDRAGSSPNLTVLHTGHGGNLFHGIVPSELGQCTMLEQLGLSNSPLTGTIPTELGNLESSLITFGQSGTRIAGSIPSEFGLLTSLAYTVPTCSRINSQEVSLRSSGCVQNYHGFG